MATALWDGIFGDAPAREHLVRRIDALATALDEPDVWAPLAAQFAALLLAGEGEIEEFWPELPDWLRREMGEAAEALESGDGCHGCYRQAADFLACAADLIEEGGR